MYLAIRTEIFENHTPHSLLNNYYKKPEPSIHKKMAIVDNFDKIYEYFPEFLHQEYDSPSVLKQKVDSLSPMKMPINLDMIFDKDAVITESDLVEVGVRIVRTLWVFKL